MKTKKRKGIKFIEGSESIAPIVAMIEHKDKVLVATTERIYEIENGKIKPLKLVRKPNP